MQLTKKEIATIVFFLAGAVLIFATSFHYFQKMITGILEDKNVKEELWFNIIFRVHIIGGLIAIFTGPFQLTKSFRAKYLKLHRKLGYIYAISVFISAVSGLVVAQFAIGGIISTLGFSALAILWLCSIVLSIQTIRNKNLLAHRKWMIINYSLTFSSIPQRFFLASALIPGLSFIDVYRVSAWFPWIFSIAIALIILNKSKLDTR